MVTALYAALLTWLFIALSVRALWLRRTLSIGLGTGDNPRMLRATRVQANFAEYAPLGLVLILLAELQQAPLWWLHLLAVLMLAGRVLHAFGVSHEHEDYRFRVAGMALTLTSLILSSLTGAGLAVTEARWP